ncbi:hypothetical protein DEO72_LG4g536 [Vigna unguiculata]|uniref:Uncharacterized protein n=1 Tax=Vigna unguiculata TaxID=3917 RepID=A0A4D6LM24_VIGUN|nr:hypothetical protein DEO72_LG4g536 [Vigna unguiculata]
MSTSRCLVAIPIGHNRQSTCEKPCYGSHTVTTGGVPNMNIVPYSHLQHSPTRAQLKSSSCSSAILSSTRGMSFRAQLKECHVLNPYPELNSRDTFRATTQGTFKVSPKPCRPHTSKATQTPLPQQHRLALLTSCQAHHASEPPGGGHVSPGAKRL